jgi:hypothetical protein
MHREHRKSGKPQLRFTTKEVAADNPQLERGLELVARLLLERWRDRNMLTASSTEDDSSGGV